MLMIVWCNSTELGTTPIPISSVLCLKSARAIMKPTLSLVSNQVCSNFWNGEIWSFCTLFFHESNNPPWTQLNFIAVQSLRTICFMMNYWVKRQVSVTRMEQCDSCETQVS